MFSRSKLVVLALLLSFSTLALSRTIGEVSTVFRALGANDKIIIEAFPDPQIPEISCYLSRAKAGGVTGAIGVAEDRSEASISCVKKSAVAKTKVLDEIVRGKHEGHDVFKKSTSIAFKTIQVVRFYDKESNTVVYLAYSDKLIEGSPNNAVFAVTLN